MPDYMTSKKLYFSAGLFAAFNFTATASPITIDLTTAGSSGTANGAIFNQINVQSTGTGVLDPFLRIQQTGTESGYNTSVGTPLDDKAGIWTHDLQLGSLGTVTQNGVSYYKFILDVNETKPGALISLNNFKLYERGSALSVANTLANLTSTSTLKFDMDGAGDTTVNINYALNSGSGSGDISVLVPVSALGVDGSQYLYLYTSFGSPYGSDAGFEEWAAVQGTTTVCAPDGGMTMILLGVAVSGLGLLKRKNS
ncbi:hypothetical protein Cflav_PD5032 [Pedosphaera parvula Ellin514]|uniref:VPDSG-CTERM protein sorting domain-containing protein n=2 Tax=Pedosphaera TaxID=1032526 RepID=B9XD51_PEDPL|nr:hypothetical protein Cflav_PD5032 [Pedosphaera parvula Ellin514]